MAFLSLADELLILVASDLGQRDVKSLLQTNRRLSGLLLPRFYDIALNAPYFKRHYSLETVLQWAVIEGHETPIREIYERKGDMTIRNNVGSTLLHLAAENGHKGVVKLLLEKGADITAQNQSGATALHVAAEKGFDGMFRLLQLVWRGSSFDKAIETVDRAGCSPLHSAAANDRQVINCEVIIRILLEEGANIAIKNVRGRTPLHLAAEKGHEGAVRLLMEHGATADQAAGFLDRAGNTPLHSAAKNGHEAVVRVLLEMGVDCTITTKSGATPLHWAAKMGHEAVVAALLENEAVVDAATQDESQSTPLHWVAESCCWTTIFKNRDPKPIIQRLLAKGADVKIANANGKTALHFAAENGEYATRRKEEKYTPGRSPRSIKVSNTNQEAVQAVHRTLITLLLDGGAKIDARDHSGSTALHCAATYGDEYAVKLLLDKGAAIEAKNNAGKTPLGAGSEYPDTDAAERVARILLDHGAQRTDQVEHENTTPLDLVDARKQRRISLLIGPVANEKRKSWIADVGTQKPEIHFLKTRVTGMFGPASFISRLVHWRRAKA